MRIAAKCVVALEEHNSVVVLGGGDGIPTRDYGVPAVEVLDGGIAGEPPDAALERLRILACTPRWGRELDDGILPAEAGLDERAISFTKGCYPGQEPVARLHARGHVNRSLRVLEIPGDAVSAGTLVSVDERSVGRVTSSVEGVALAYVRTDLPEHAKLEVAGRLARIH
jgi:folate-binding protein YgfZ